MDAPGPPEVEGVGSTCILTMFVRAYDRVGSVERVE